MEFDKTYDLVFRHGSKAGVLSTSLAALGRNILNLLLGAVSKVARVLIVGHCGAVFGELVQCRMVIRVML